MTNLTNAERFRSCVTNYSKNILIQMNNLNTRYKNIMVFFLWISENYDIYFLSSLAVAQHSMCQPTQLMPDFYGVYFEPNQLLTLLAFVLPLNPYALCVDALTVLVVALSVDIRRCVTYTEQLMTSPPLPFPKICFNLVLRCFSIDCLCKQISLSPPGTGWSRSSEKHKDNCLVVFRTITLRFDTLLISWKNVFTVAVLQKKVL